MEPSTTQRRGSRAADDSPHEVARRGTVKERARYVSERRKAETSPGKVRRRQIGRKLGKRASLQVTPELGFARAEPGRLPGAEAAIESAMAQIERIGHEALLQAHKKPMAKGFLPVSDLSRDSTYMQFALSDEIVSIVSGYLGVVPILNYVDVWYSAHLEKPTRSSQLFHLDHADITQLKLFLHCADVGPASGPLTILDASESRKLAKRVKYRFESSRVADEAVEAAIGPNRPVVLDGPRGAAHFVDTSRCFHFGSRVQAGAAPRQLVVFQYLTPYAFEFLADHRQEAQFRELATDDSSERDRLVLGAD